MKKKYPFKFLDAYTKDDTGIFFGRDEEINALYEMVFQTDIILLYGASGTGKTSLIQCGLSSKFQSHDWLAIPIRRGNDLNESLEKALKEAIGPKKVDTDEAIGWLSGFMQDKNKIASSKQLRPLEKSFRSIYLQYFRPIYLIFDQFEELFILGNTEEQDRFIRNVQEILKVEQPVKMIFSIREEYLGHLDKFEKAVSQLLRKKLRVEPMNFEKVSKVIYGASHLENSNVRLQSGEETAITEGIFDKLKGGHKSLTIELPYLQVFLDKLYTDITKDETRQKDALFTMGELSKLGDIGDVLRDFLEEQVKIISRNIKAEYPEAKIENIWKILSPFVTLEGTKEPIPRETLLDRLPGINHNLIDKSIDSFVNRRILRKSEKEDMENIYEITHDSLAQRIAEKRTTEENALLEIVRIIKSQAVLKGDARELFTERQLNYIEPFLEKLREQKLIEKDGEDLLEKSRLKIELDRKVSLAVQQRELELANKRAKDEEELRKTAVESESKAKKRSRYAAVAAILAVIIAGIAFNFYFEAKEASEKTQEANIEIEQKSQEIQKNLDLITYQQVESKAKELLTYGDSYRNLEEKNLACESYSAGLKILKGYPQDSVYLELEQKSKEVCEQ